MEKVSVNGPLFLVVLLVNFIFEVTLPGLNDVLSFDMPCDYLKLQSRMSTQNMSSTF